MEIKPPKGLNIYELSDVFKLLAEPSRLKILSSLDLNCRPVSEIVSVTQLSQTNVSFHLKLLRKAGMVRPQRVATHIYYCLPNQDLMKIVEKMLEWMKTRENYDSV